MMKHVAVIGSGTWGTALANLLCAGEHDVTLWSAIGEEIDYIARTHRHPNIKDAVIDERIHLTKSMADAMNHKDVLVLAVPSVFVRSTAAKMAPHLSADQIVVTVVKGMEASTLMTMSEVTYEELTKVQPLDYGQIVALSGPTHAEEVSIGLPSTIVSASENEENAQLIQEVFSTSFMRVYTNSDIKGVEICGALKNIIALACGVSQGLGYGDNATAALITRGIHEMSRLGLAMGCPIHTFYGLAGIGDLIVTCTSRHSRNNQCGHYIGEGYPVDEAIKKVGMVVEGVNALDAAYELIIKYHIELPIIRGVYDIVKFNIDPHTAVTKLFDRHKKSEMPFDQLELMYKAPQMDKTKGPKRIITYGTFDLLHYGHINLLERARSLGDYLIVALSTDEFTTEQKHKHCYFSYEERKSLLEAIRYVDLVIPEATWDQKLTDCQKYHVDTLVMGEDWEGCFDDLKMEGIEVVYLPRTPEVSTTKIKNEMRESEE